MGSGALVNYSDCVTAGSSDYVTDCNVNESSPGFTTRTAAR